MSRARDVMPMPSSSNSGSLIIDVAVEEATVEHRAEDGENVWPGAPAVSVATVYTGTLRTQRSSPGMNEKAGWVTKAKDITSKFRRRSVAVLNPSNTVSRLA